MWIARYQIQTFVLLFLLSLIPCFAVAQDQQEDSKVAPEHLIAEVPGLSAFGPQRLTWGVLRPPLLWMQDRLISLNEMDWPSWDREQVPTALSPARKNKSFIQIFDSQDKLITEVALEKAFFPDIYLAKKSHLAARYRLKILSKDGRVTMISPSYAWIRRREVFSCENEFEEGKTLRKMPAVWTCLQTLKRMVGVKDQQWYFKVSWPKVTDRSVQKELLILDRELRAIANRSANVYDSEKSMGLNLSVHAGVTQMEKFEAVSVDYSLWPKKNILMLPPTREKIQQIALAYDFAGFSIEIQSFAADELVARQKQSPPAFKTPIDIQFIAAAESKTLRMLETEFIEYRTGLKGFLRPWHFAVNVDHNTLTSNRGEQDSFFSLPGFDVAYQSKFYDLQGALSLTSGLLHMGSSLTVQEIQASLRRRIEFIPFAQAVVGYHRYSLNGKNPGSSRLGKMDAAALGISGLHSFDESFVQAKLLFLISDAVGFDTQLGYGRYLNTNSDLKYYWGGFVGSSKYASTLTNRMLESETFTEDRFRVGLMFGLLGPDFISPP